MQKQPGSCRFVATVLLWRTSDCVFLLCASCFCRKCQKVFTRGQDARGRRDTLKKALDFVNAKEYKWEDKKYEKFIKQRTNNPDTTYYPKGELIIVRDYLKGGNNFKLAWKFIISTFIPNDEQLIFIDANTGEVISKRSLILDANTQGTAATMYSGSQGIICDSYSGGYRLREDRNGVSVQTMNMQGGNDVTSAIDFTNSNTNWTNGSWSNFTMDKQALDAHWGAEKVLDFWRNIFGRNSLDGNGLQILGYVHTKHNWDNAIWDPSSRLMEYGDGDGIVFRPLTAIDVIGHEMGHGINEFTADLGSSTGNQESDALNEGFSDIWGASVEHWAAPEKQTWLIGEDILISPYTCLRNLKTL